MPEKGRPILERYVERGWVFVAMKIAPPARDDGTRKALGDGTLQPIRFRFPAEEPVFPLEISALGGHPSTVLLYVAAPDALVPSEPHGKRWEKRLFSGPELGRRFEVHSRSESGGEADLEGASGSALGLLLARPGFSMGKFRAVFPASEMRDVTFRRYQPTEALRGGDAAGERPCLLYC